MNPILQRYDGRLPFSVNERDIDLLLIEQLHVSKGFADRLVSVLGLEGATMEKVEHSVYREHGETDVLLTVRHEGQRVAVMIEDKIGAVIQPDQCRRYHVRGQALCDSGDVERYFTVLCAPASYISGVPVSDKDDWHRRISFEEIAQIVSDEAFPGWEWRHALLDAASSRRKRAYAANNKTSTQYDPMIAELKVAYRNFVLANYPKIKASEQTGKDREYFLGIDGLPSGIRFKHSFFAGDVSLIFEKRWVEVANRILAKEIPPDAWLAPHGSELHVRIATEVMDPDAPFDGQEEIVAAALEKILRMEGLAKSVAEAS
ncbi:hypothetical protein CSC94_11525 [Zhengella mangrovi]|uniref:PD-(D/E)XK nuclease superfamily protein n=1 Tax=Zhengella mangrovi TaxID=1982044 RepID=A0A2G1QMI1_9HYPH|nr:hypothetical protein [Zhengella mangrovi]PHP66737.1 hypothetical protein CSC94_11525 [Zhengella mangrovi]